MAATETESPSDIGYLSGLLETTRLVRSGAPLDELLDAIARTVADALGFGAVVVNIYRPAWDDLIACAIVGTDEARDVLLGTTQSVDSWRPLLDETFLRHGAYFIKAGDIDWGAHDLKVFVPQLSSSSGAEAWDAEDALFVPMEDRHGKLLGILSVDEPVSGRRPADHELDILVAFAAHAAFAIEQAQRAQEADEHRRALQSLMKTSAEATCSSSPGEVLGSVVEGVRDALGFQRVMIAMLGPEGNYEVEAFAGWEPDDPAVVTKYPAEDMDRLFDPSFDLEGCYLMEREEALRRVNVSFNTYSSTMNGRGPRAWNHHWLMIPLWGRDGSITGVLMADEPEDRCLPSPERLKALRLFANDAAAVVESCASLAAEQEAKTLLGTFISASPVAIIGLDTDMRVTLWNPAAEGLLGWREDELLQGALPLQAQLQAELTRAVRTGASVETETQLFTKTGEPIECAASVAPIVWEGEVRGVVCLIADVTSRNQMAEKLRQSQKLETVGLLAGGIAHDFNNLLAAILGNATLALDDVPAGSPLHDSLSDIMFASETAAELTRQLLAYAGKATTVWEWVDLSALLRDSARLLKRALPDEVRLSTTFEDALPMVRGDTGQLRQIAMNLIKNAAESIEGHGLVSLSTRSIELTTEDTGRLAHSEGARPGLYVSLEVTDTGSGIAPEDLSRVFDPFFSTKFIGRGLGLASLLGIVRSHQGVIEIDSTPGEGSTFRICLPAEASAEPVPGTAAPSDRERVAGTLLLVEDEMLVRAMGTRMLAGAGFDVLEASSGEEAVAIIEQNPAIDLVVLDVSMPGLSGIETMRRIRTVAPRVLFVVCSGHSEQQVGTDFGFAGEAMTFVGKPYRRDVLVGAVAQALDGRNVPS